MVERPESESSKAEKTEFFTDRVGEVIFITEFVPEERDNLIKMYLDFSKEKRCCGLPPVKKEMIKSWIDYLDSNGFMFIAKHGERVVGHIAAVPVNSSAEIVIFVHQDYEGKNIGKKLIRMIEKTIQKKDIKKMLANTEEGNRVAIKLYSELGFKIAEIKKGFITFEKEINK